MKYRKLGNTGIEVSEIAFGAEFLVENFNPSDIAVNKSSFLQG